MTSQPVDYMLLFIIIFSCLSANALGDGPVCTANGVFEYCLSQQGLNVSQSIETLCSVDKDMYEQCQLSSLQNCPFSSNISVRDVLDLYFGLIRGCTFANSFQCQTTPCQNGGTCNGFGTIQFCSCPFGFFGDVCEYRHDQGPTGRPTRPPPGSGSTQCTSLSCQNGGSCVRYGETEMCHCIFGYFGNTCELPVAPRSLPTSQTPGITNKPCIDCEAENDNSDGLGVGTIAGIAIGAMAVLLLFGILLALLLRGRRQKLDSAQSSIPLNTEHQRRKPHRPVNPSPRSERKVTDSRLPAGSPPTEKCKGKPQNSRPTKENPSQWVGEYLTPIPSERYTRPQVKIHPPEHDPQADNSTKSRSKDPISRSLQDLPATDGYRYSSGLDTENPARWEEDYVTPLPSEAHFRTTPSERHHGIRRETSDGYLLPVSHGPGATVPEDVHIYTELDYNEMTL